MSVQVDEALAGLVVVVVTVAISVVAGSVVKSRGGVDNVSPVVKAGTDVVAASKEEQACLASSNTKEKRD